MPGGVKVIIAIAGMPGSGKSVVAEFFRKRGYKVYCMGDIVRREVERRGLKKTSENMLRVAEDIRRKYGLHGVALLLAKELEGLKDDVVVIDGVRSIDELKVLAKIADCIHVIAVHASPKTRFRRIVSRGREGDPRSWEEFVDRDRRELKFGIGGVIAIADTMIVNEDEEIDNIYKQLNSRMEEILACSLESELKYL